MHFAFRRSDSSEAGRTGITQSEAEARNAAQCAELGLAWSGGVLALLRDRRRDARKQPMASGGADRLWSHGMINGADLATPQARDRFSRKPETTRGCGLSVQPLRN
jgi:hypothetical protein